MIFQRAFPAAVSDTGLGIYVHIPFCRSRCNYCHFVSSTSSEATVTRYGALLRREIEDVAKGREHLLVNSIYFGGGTPSLVPEGLIADVIGTIRQCLLVSRDCEISLEANPETITVEKAEGFRLIGITRISLGVQSFVDNELGAVARSHDVAASSRSLSILRESGFTNLNMDLILGLPGQTIGSWRYSLEQALAALPAHMSIYMLDLDDPGVPLHQAVLAREVNLPDDDELADWYTETVERLSRNGLLQYEISNFAAEGMTCRHNMKYWMRQPVLGFGVGSHSFDGSERYANVSDVSLYMDLVEARKSPIEWRCHVDETASIEESLFLGLRLNQGVDLQSLWERFDPAKVSVVEGSLGEMSDCGLVEREGHIVRLTGRGRLLANDVFSALLH